MQLNLHEELIEHCLFDGLIELLYTTPIDKLSVNQIIRKANVGHSTFYRHYKDKYDLLNQSYKKLMNETLFKVIEGENLHDLIVIIYSVLKQNYLPIANAIESKDPNSLKNLIFKESYDLYSKILIQHGVDMADWENILKLRSYIWGNLEITCNWLLEGANYPVEKMADIFIEGIPVPFNKYFI